MRPRGLVPGSIGEVLQPVYPAAAGVPGPQMVTQPSLGEELIEQRETHVLGPQNPPPPQAAPPFNAAAAILQQLSQLVRATPDAVVSNKLIVDNLVSKGLAVRASGYTIATGKGIGYLVDLGML